MAQLLCLIKTRNASKSASLSIGGVRTLSPPDIVPPDIIPLDIIPPPDIIPPVIRHPPRYSIVVSQTIDIIIIIIIKEYYTNSVNKVNET